MKKTSNSSSVKVPIKLINDFILVCFKNYLLILIHGSVKLVIKNEELTITTTTNKFENHLLSIRAEHQKRIRLDWTHIFGNTFPIIYGYYLPIFITFFSFSSCCIFNLEMNSYGVRYLSADVFCSGCNQ
jgi:hypothetical protein